MTDAPPDTPADTPPSTGGGPSSAISEQVRQARERLQRLRGTVESERETVEDQMARMRAQDRSEIARIIVWLFAGSFLLVLLALPLIAWRTNSWDGVGAQLVDLLSSVLLPVLTLVIGYYFGTEQQNRRKDGR